MGSEAFKKICRIAGDTVVRYRLIKDNDRIMVGLSGGKDSFVLMHLLDHLRRHAPVKFSLTAATFDPGFDNFNAGVIAEYCRLQQWEHHIVKTDIPSLVREKGERKTPCVLCSRLRRGKLYGLACSLGCGKLALGQHLDDVISSFFMSVCRGQGISSMAPMVQPKNPAHPLVIRPLALVQEALIQDAAGYFDLPKNCGTCHYKEDIDNGDRAMFRKLTDALAEKIPDLRGNMIHSLSRVEADHLLIPPK